MLTGITFLGVIKKEKERSCGRRIALINSSKIVLHQTGLLQRLESAILGNCFQGAGRQLDSHKAIKFRNPDSFRLQIGGEQSRRIGGDVLTNAPFFLGHTAPVNDVTLRRFGACDAAFSSHNESSLGEEPGRSAPLPPSSRSKLAPEAVFLEIRRLRSCRLSRNSGPVLRLHFE